MSVISVEIPDDVRVALDAAARREQKSLEQVASGLLTRILQAQEQLDYLAGRAKQASRKGFDGLLDKVPDQAPAPNDKL